MLNSALNEIYTESISYTKCKIKYNWYGNGDIRALIQNGDLSVVSHFSM